MADQLHPPSQIYAIAGRWTTAKVCAINFIRAPVCGKTELGLLCERKFRVRAVDIAIRFVYVSCRYGNRPTDYQIRNCYGLI